MSKLPSPKSGRKYDSVFVNDLSIASPSIFSLRVDAGLDVARHSNSVVNDRKSKRRVVVDDDSIEPLEMEDILPTTLKLRMIGIKEKKRSSLQ